MSGASSTVPIWLIGRCRLAPANTEHALPVALEPEHPFTLTRAQELDNRGKAELALVESFVGGAEVLLHLPHVHRRARRLAGALEDVLRALDGLAPLRRIDGGRGRDSIPGFGDRHRVCRLRSVSRRALRRRVSLCILLRVGGRGGWGRNGRQRCSALPPFVRQLHEEAAPGVPQRDHAGLRNLLDEVAERAGAVVAFGAIRNRPA